MRINFRLVAVAGLSAGAALALTDAAIAHMASGAQAPQTQNPAQPVYELWLSKVEGASTYAVTGNGDTLVVRGKTDDAKAKVLDSNEGAKAFAEIKQHADEADDQVVSIDKDTVIVKSGDDGAQPKDGKSVKTEKKVVVVTDGDGDHDNVWISEDGDKALDDLDAADTDIDISGADGGRHIVIRKIESRDSKTDGNVVKKTVRIRLKKTSDAAANLKADTAMQKKRVVRIKKDGEESSTIQITGATAEDARSFLDDIGLSAEQKAAAFARLGL